METIPKPHRSHNWLWIAGLWLGLAVFDATQMIFAMRHEGMNHSWARMFFATARPRRASGNSIAMKLLRRSS